jgi:hypothetical protein
VEVVGVGNGGRDNSATSASSGPSGVRNSLALLINVQNHSSVQFPSPFKLNLRLFLYCVILYVSLVWDMAIHILDIAVRENYFDHSMDF